MKYLFSRIVFVLVYSIQPALAQTVFPVTEQQLEDMAAAEETETEDDSYMELLTYYKKHPLNVNVAGAGELQGLLLLTDLQIHHFIAYRNTLGKLVNIYELQAVPSWDIVTIRKLLPFITIHQTESAVATLRHRLKSGEHRLLLRASQVLERAKGFEKNNTGASYLGNRQKYFFRYRYTYKNLLQFGLTADKDAGEPFFKGAQRYGFDFYSAHIFAREAGMIKSLAIGDFTVNMGQGLIQWQSLAFKKSIDVSGIKRQSPVLKPYTSAGEYNFHRGVGITVQKGKIDLTLFASVRKLSGNMGQREDSTGAATYYFSSFNTSGYHRTATEIANKNQLQQVSSGGNISYRFKNGYIGVNIVSYLFSASLEKRADPYNHFAIAGKKWANGSVDYGWTHKNFHFFGEAALDKNGSTAFVNGLMISIDKTVDMALLHRRISQSYQAVNGNAFTEHTFPANETGYYVGITMRPTSGLKIDGYADLFVFPWLKYLVDAPANGSEYATQLTYTPDKGTELYLRFRKESKQVNEPGNVTPYNYLVYQNRMNWRFHLSHKLNRAVTLRSRVEWVQYNRDKSGKEEGVLFFADCLYKPLLKPVGAGLRLQYFETDSYYSRVYAFENDVLYSYSIPVFYDKGYRYYINLNYDITRKITCWFRWAQLIYREKQTVGSGLDAIPGNRKSEVKVQISIVL